MSINDFLTVITTIGTIFLSIMTLINSRQLKMLELHSSEMDTKLKIHYTDKLSPIKDFLLAAGEFSANPTSEDAFNKMISTSGVAIYVSLNSSKSHILDFIDFATRIKSNEVEPTYLIHSYEMLCANIGQETVDLNEQSCTKESL